MPDLTSPRFAPKFAAPSEAARPLYLVTPDELAQWRAAQPAPARAWLEATCFKAGAGALSLLPDAAGQAVAAVAGLGTAAAQARQRFALAGALDKLPAGPWALASDLPPAAAEEAALGALFAQYRFEQKSKPADALAQAQLVAPAGIDATRLEAIAAGECLTRELINLPANLMGPAALEAVARDLAAMFGAGIQVTTGEGLLEAGLPLIHTVGRASPRAPRLIDLSWGETGPSLTLVGKGICFDTGGLNLKPGGSMALMKKDMGGAATVLGLARMIMALGLPLRLRVLLPVAENALGGAAFRPGDILTSRKGLTVEINNTDAEGRLVLADALALGAEAKPDLMISMATLTGAARVAVGPDIAPFFTDAAPLAAALEAAGAAVRDPVWRLPLHAPYEEMIEPAAADLDNAPSGGFAGAITAALFLRRFADGAGRYAHFDIYGWQPTAAPARPKGGVGQGARAILAALPQMLGLEAA